MTRPPDDVASCWKTWPGTQRATEALTLTWPPCDARCNGSPHDPDLRLLLADLEVDWTPARGGDWWDMRRKTEIERRPERFAVRPATEETPPESRLPRLTRLRRIASTDGTWGAFSRHAHKLVVEDLFEIGDGPFGGQLVAIQSGPAEDAAWLAGKMIVLDHAPARDPAATAQFRSDFLRDNHAEYDLKVWRTEAAAVRARGSRHRAFLPGEFLVGAMPGLEDAQIGNVFVFADLGFIPHEVSLASPDGRTVLARGPHDPLRPTWTVRFAAGAAALEIVAITSAEAGALYGPRGPEVAAFPHRLRRLDPERCGDLRGTDGDLDGLIEAHRAFEPAGRFPLSGSWGSSLDYFGKSAVGRAFDDAEEVLGRAFSDAPWLSPPLRLAGLVAGEIAGGKADLDRALRRKATMLREIVEACPLFEGPDPDYPTLEHAGVRELSAIAFPTIGRPLLMNHEGLVSDRQIGAPIVDFRGNRDDVWVHAGQPVWASPEDEHAAHPKRANELGCFTIEPLQLRAEQRGVPATRSLRGFRYVALLTALDDDPILHESERAAATVAAIDARVRSDPRRARLW